MKYLSDYMEEKQTALFNKTGAIFAFSSKQFNEQKKQGVKYTILDGGIICPTENITELENGLESIFNEAIKQDFQENGKEAIIKRELSNYECYYTGNISEAVRVLKDYGIEKAEIIPIFKKELELCTDF
jgi:hypothetical protein